MRWARSTLGARGPGRLQNALSDPTVLLGALESPAQRALPRLDAIVAVVIGYVDHIVDEVGRGLVGSSGRIAEAVRRRRVEADASDAYVERLLGLTLGRAQVERGHAFVEGVLERAGQEGLGRLWSSEAVLPTPPEVDAPGLWLARIDIEGELGPPSPLGELGEGWTGERDDVGLDRPIRSPRNVKTSQKANRNGSPDFIWPWPSPMHTTVSPCSTLRSTTASGSPRTGG